MAVQNALIDFAEEELDFTVSEVKINLEEVAVLTGTSTTSSMARGRPLIATTNHAIDATSRAVSFMLGFALASVLAWLMSLVGNDTPHERSVSVAATKVNSVAPAVEPVVTLATPVPAEPVAPAATTSVTAVAPPPAPLVKKREPLLKAAAPLKASAPLQASVQRKPAVSGYVGALAVSSTPEGAQVWVNGRAAGETPLVLEELPAGSRAIVLRRDGYSPWSASVRVVAGQRLPVRVTLKPTDQ
jgi:hypothetical protein